MHRSKNDARVGPRGIIVAVGVALLLTACQGGSTEPGSGETTVTADTPTPSASNGSTVADTPEPSSSSASPEEPDEPSGTPEASSTPEASFTQPYVPGEPSVITLPETLPVETPRDPSAAGQEVVDALGRAMAVWDSILFGADPEEVNIETVFAEDMLRSLSDYAEESRDIERVSVGSPTRTVVQDLSVGAMATVDVCFYTPDWVEYIGGEEAGPVDAVSGYRMRAEARQGEWKFTGAREEAFDC